MGDRLLDRLSYTARVDPDRLGEAGDQVPTLYVQLALPLQRHGRSQPDLDPLRRGLADQEAVGLTHEVDDGLIQLISTGPDRGVAHDAGQRDDGDIGGPAPDVDHHSAD